MATCDVTTKRSEEVTFTIIMRQICTPKHRGKKQAQFSLCGQILSLSPQQISSYFYSLPSYRIFTVQVPSPWPLATARAAAGKSHDLQLAAAQTLKQALHSTPDGEVSCVCIVSRFAHCLGSCSQVQCFDRMVSLYRVQN